MNLKFKFKRVLNEKNYLQRVSFVCVKWVYLKNKCMYTHTHIYIRDDMNSRLMGPTI
jgi:hypothetical protein